jgi:hypothetical protein
MEHRGFENRLREFRTKGPPVAARERLLTRAQDAVADRRVRQWRARRLGLAMAAAFAVALAANLAVNQVTDARIAALTGGPVIAQHDGAAIAAAMHQRARMLSMLDHERGWD